MKRHAPGIRNRFIKAPLSHFPSHSLGSILSQPPERSRLCGRSVRGINQPQLHTSCATDIQAEERKHGDCWYVLSAGSHKRLLTAAPTQLSPGCVNKAAPTFWFQFSASGDLWDCSFLFSLPVTHLLSQQPGGCRAAEPFMSLFLVLFFTPKWPLLLLFLLTKATLVPFPADGDEMQQIKISGDVKHGIKRH